MGTVSLCVTVRHCGVCFALCSRVADSGTISSTTVQDVRAAAGTVAQARRALRAMEGLHNSLGDTGASLASLQAEQPHLRHLLQTADQQLLSWAVTAAVGKDVMSVTDEGVEGQGYPLHLWASLPRNTRAVAVSALQHRVQEHGRVLAEATEVNVHFVTQF